MAVQGKSKEVKTALQAQPAPSNATRQHCADRLISLLDTDTKAPLAPPEPVNTKKLSKTKKRKLAEMAADGPAAAAVQTARPESPFLAETLAFVMEFQGQEGVSLAVALPEEMPEALDKLHQAAAAASATAGG